MSLTQEQIEKLSKNLSKIDLAEPKLVDDLNNIFYIYTPSFYL